MTSIVGLLLAIATPPAGDPAAPALRWRAPPGCPTHDDVAASLAAQAATTTDAQPSPLATDATVRETAAGTWAVTITVTSTTDEIHRELDSCAAAAEAVALIYGLALTGELDPAGDPDPATNEPAVPPSPAAIAPPPSGASEPRGTVVAPVVAPVRGPSSSVPPRRGRPQLAIHLDGGGGVGTLARGGGHAVLGLGAAWRRVRIGGRVDHAFVRRSDGSSADLGVEVSSTTGGVEVAIVIPLAPIELLPGLDLRAGALRARGVGGRRGDTRWVPWALVAGGMSLVWMAADAIGLRVGAAVEVPLVRHVFAFDDLEVARTRGVGGLFVAGLELRFLRGRR